MTTRGSMSARTFRLAGCTLVVLGILVACGGAAHAQGKLIDLHGAVLVGGSTGNGSAAGGTDFYHQTQGPGFGGEVGVRLLVLDLSIRFLQMVGSDGREGTQSTLFFGPSIEIPILGGGTDSAGRHRPVTLVIRPALVGGLVFGTPAPVSPPLTGDQISAKGVLGMGRLAVEWMFGPIFGLGVEAEGGYHYLIGASGVVNGPDHSSGWQMAGFGTAAFHLGI
jgi:hypothetical protein